MIYIFLCYQNSRKSWKNHTMIGWKNCLNKYDILSPCQYGFRSNIDHNKYAIGIFVDLKKAFDTVKHGIMAIFLLLWHSWYYTYMNVKLLSK